MAGEDIFLEFFSIIISVKAYHYRTKYYGHHKACDWFFDKFLEHADRFLECYQGKYGRIEFDTRDNVVNMPIKIITDNTWQHFIEVNVKYLLNKLPKIIDNKDKDLMTIKDELQADLTQFSYLLQFK